MASKYEDYFKSTGTVVKGLGSVPKPPTPTVTNTAAPTVPAMAAAKAAAATAGTNTTPIPKVSVPDPAKAPLNAAQAYNMPGIPQSSPIPVPPSTGYGGANYGNANADTRQAIEANEKWLNSNPNNVLSEQQRALGVIAERKKQGLDISEQQDYLYNRLGYKEPEVTQPKPLISSVSTSTPSAPSQTSYSQLTPAQIDQEAKYKIDKERADLQTAANKKLAQLMTNANYTNQLIKDARVMENLDFARNNNPFSGKTGYLAEQLTRGREIDDTYRMGNLNAELNAVQEDLYNFDKLSPDKQRALINEMTRIERQYGLDVADRTGFLEGNRTLQGQQFDWGKQMDVADRLGTLNGQRTLQGQALDLQGKQANWGAYMDMVNQTQNLGQGPTDTWGDLITRSQSPNAPLTASGKQQQVENNRWQQQFDTGNQQWQQQFDYNKTMDAAKLQQSAQQFAQQMGYNWSKMSQDQKQFAQDMAYKQYNLGLQQAESKFNQGMQAFKETGVMPDFMSQYGISTAAINNEATKQDVMALYDQLSKGVLTPDQAIKTIDDKVRIGAESAQDGETMKQAIYTLYPDLKQGSSGNGGGGLITVPSYVSDASNSIIDGAKSAGSNFLSWWGKQWSNMLPK